MSDNISTDTAGTETASTEAPSTEANILDAGTVETSPTETSSEAPAQWFDGLSEDVTSHKGFEGVKGKIKDVDALTMSYLNLQSRMGSGEENGLKAPTAESTPEELSEFYNAAGRPETAGDYKFDGLPEGMELDTERLTERNAAIHAAGLSQSQYETVMGLYTEEMNMVQDQLQMNQANIRNETEVALKDEWGTDYDKNIKSVAAVADRFGVKEELISSGVINQQFIMKMLHQVHLSTSEDGIVKAANSGYNRADEYKQVMAQLAALPYNHPDRAALQAKQVKLSQ